MNKRKTLNTVIAIIFAAFEGYMFYLIHFEKADYDFDPRYTAIIAAAIFSLLIQGLRIIFARMEDRRIRDVLLDVKGGGLICLAMMFTLVADYFLVALPEEMPLEGVTVFLGTQLFIFLHIIAKDEDPLWRRRQILTRIVISCAMVPVAYAILGDDADRLAITSVVYYANLLASVIFAHRSGRGGIMLTVGLILFALCDVNVGLSALDSIYVGGFPEGSLLYSLVNSDIDLVWVFYIPSQTLIPMTMMLCDEE